MKAHNGSAARDQWKPPPGCVSAKAKAYAKWKETNGNPSKKVNMLTEDRINDADDDSSDEESFRICSIKSNRSPGHKIAPPPAPLATKNSSETFDVDSDGIAALGDWRTMSPLENHPSQHRRKLILSLTNKNSKVYGRESKCRSTPSRKE